MVAVIVVAVILAAVIVVAVIVVALVVVAVIVVVCDSGCGDSGCGDSGGGGWRNVHFVHGDGGRVVEVLLVDMSAVVEPVWLIVEEVAVWWSVNVVLVAREAIVVLLMCVVSFVSVPKTNKMIDRLIMMNVLTIMAMHTMMTATMLTMVID